MDIVSSIVFISCPSLRTSSENLDSPAAYLKSFLCSLNLVLKFMLVLPILLSYFLNCFILFEILLFSLFVL